MILYSSCCSAKLPRKCGRIITYIIIIIIARVNRVRQRVCGSRKIYIIVPTTRVVVFVKQRTIYDDGTKSMHIIIIIPKPNIIHTRKVSRFQHFIYY